MPEESDNPIGDLPDWLTSSQDYRPGPDRDGFIMRNLLSLASVLAQLRLDDGRDGPLSPSPPVKLLLALGAILLTSLSRNYLFVLAMLAVVLVRAAMLPRAALARVTGGSLAAAGLTLVLMLPAALIGQPRSALFLATKSLVTVGITLTVALTTPKAHLTSALRQLGMPAVVILTVDLALHGIVRLGQTAQEVLVALRLRSVGTNRAKGATMGGVGGVVLVKASRLAQDSYDAMRCRGFDGSYRTGASWRPRGADALWAAGFALVLALFLYLQGVV